MFTKSLPTVSGVMAAFRKTITELETVVNEQGVEANRQAEIAAQAQAASAAASAESAEALKVKAKMEAIFA